MQLVNFQKKEKQNNLKQTTVTTVLFFIINANDKLKLTGSVRILDSLHF